MVFMVHLTTGLLLVGIGYLLKYKKWSWLIAGFNTSSKEEKAKYDELSLCEFMGKFMFVLAGIIFVAALGAYIDISWMVMLSWVLFVVVTIAALVYMNTGNRFKK